MMSELYPVCSQCECPLGVRAGIKRGNLIFCNSACEALYYEPPASAMKTEEAILFGALETLRQSNPTLDENSLLTLYYLGWESIPSEGSEDYALFNKVYGWVTEKSEP